MTNYSKNKPQAAAFLAFMASDEGQKIIADNGIIPAKEGFTSDQRMAKNLLDLAANQGFTRYPMIDNVIQPEVSDVGTKVLNAAFGGAQSMTDALTSMQQALDAAAGRVEEPDQVADRTAGRDVDLVVPARSCPEPDA